MSANPELHAVLMQQPTVDKIIPGNVWTLLEAAVSEIRYNHQNKSAEYRTGVACLLVSSGWLRGKLGNASLRGFDDVVRQAREILNTYEAMEPHTQKLASIILQMEAPF